MYNHLSIIIIIIIISLIHSKNYNFSTNYPTRHLIRYNRSIDRTGDKLNDVTRIYRIRIYNDMRSTQNKAMEKSDNVSHQIDSNAHRCQYFKQIHAFLLL